MINNGITLRNEEKVVFALCSLYEKFGYNQFKMSKFEEYDLYVQNKDFLVSDNVITFTDTTGKLMALKPDVTLSIVKNSTPSPSAVEKVYYNENVYRISKGSYSFREIMQVGLECIGDIDEYCIFEVLFLAAESLRNISDDFVLDISHLGVVSELIKQADVLPSQRATLLKCIGEKNTDGIFAVCGEKGEKLIKLVKNCSNAATTLSVLEEIFNNNLPPSVNELTDVVSALEEKGYGNKIRIDFSVLNNMNYYSGIVFRGFINGIPAGILSGGQYDHLMKKMKKSCKAVGFAVYMDMLERLDDFEKEFDIDTVVLYDEKTSPKTLRKTVSNISDSGLSVLALKIVPETLKFRHIIDLRSKEVSGFGKNA